MKRIKNDPIIASCIEELNKNQDVNVLNLRDVLERKIADVRRLAKTLELPSHIQDIAAIRFGNFPKRYLNTRSDVPIDDTLCELLSVPYGSFCSYNNVNNKLNSMYRNNNQKESLLKAMYGTENLPTYNISRYDIGPFIRKRGGWTHF